MKNLVAYGVFLLIGISNPIRAWAQHEGCSSEIGSQTSAEIETPVAVLALQLRPLTKCELLAEADAWFMHLKAKVAEISIAEIAMIYEKEQITATQDLKNAIGDIDYGNNNAAKKKGEEVQEALIKAKEAEQKTADLAIQRAITDAVEEVKEERSTDESIPDNLLESKVEVKNALNQHVITLDLERTAIIDRIDTVLDELRKKGGEVKVYKDYIAAVSGIHVDVTDASATWTTVSGWLKAEDGGIRWAINFLQFFGTLILFSIFAIIVGKATGSALSRSPNLSSLLKDFLVQVSKRLVFVIGLFVGLSALEFNLGPVLAVVGAAGFVIAFALQNSLSNFASGILILFYRPFDVNDVVDVAGVLGKVESMNLLSTQLRTPDNKLMIVPNNSVWGDVITNVTGISERRVDLIFGIGYSDDVDKAQSILESILSAHEHVLSEPKSLVRVHELADSSVNFICRPWVKPEHYWDVYWDVTREVKRRFDAEGVSIPFPQRDVHIFQTGNTLAL
ncbi:MAG: small conductance mechanosensitive channel [Paraglaciecola sp.]|jgi:small conductance mechanosensitive channel